MCCNCFAPCRPPFVARHRPSLCSSRTRLMQARSDQFCRTPSDAHLARGYRRHTKGRKPGRRREEQEQTKRKTASRPRHQTQGTARVLPREYTEFCSEARKRLEMRPRKIHPQQRTTRCLTRGARGGRQASLVCSPNQPFTVACNV